MRISQLLPGSAVWGDVVPASLESGMGGRETALIRLAQHWASAGHEVVSYVPIQGEPVHVEYDAGGRASYVTHELAAGVLSTFPQDAVVSWEAPGLFQLEHVRRMSRCNVCAMQVAHVMEGSDAIGYPDLYQALSGWHAQFLADQDPRIAARPIVVLPNCVELERFPQSEMRQHAGPPRFLYASSPDRGLIHLLDAWPELRRRLPGCTLSVAYGVEQWIEASVWSHSLQAEQALIVRDSIKQEGVRYLGRIGQGQLARAHLSSDFLLYPCDPIQPTETGCITVLEAAAAGNVPVLTDADCLGSEFSEIAEIVPLPYDQRLYVSAVVSLVRDRARADQLRRAGRALAERRSWGQVAPKWIELFEAVHCGQIERRAA